MLRLFGAQHHDGDGTNTSELPDKTFLLIALLSLEFSRSAGRGAIATRLWEQVPQPNANLRAQLSLIRKWEVNSGATVLRTNPARVWRDDTCLASDLDIFLGIETLKTPEDLDLLAKLYTGDLLTTLRSGNGPALLSWLDLQRGWLRQRFVRLALPAAKALGGLAADTMLRRLSQEAPYDDGVEQALLMQLAREHSAAAAAAEYDAYRQRLADELGVEPELETQSLAAMLRLGTARATAPIPARAAIAAEPTTLASAVSQFRSEIPKVLLLPPPASESLVDQQLAGALIDDVTYALCRMRSFSVFAPHSARQAVQGHPLSDTSPYDADYILSTRLLPGLMPNEIRFGYSLTKCSTQQVLAGDHVRFQAADMSVRFADLTGLVAKLVAGQIERSELTEYRRSGTASAYVNFLLGQELLRTVELGPVRRARRHFRLALDMQPGFVPAICQLSRTLSLEWLLLGRVDKELLGEAMRLAKHAIELDPLDPGAYRELGNALLYLQDLDESLERLEVARMRAPHHADILLDCANALLHNSRYGEAKQAIDQAMRLNPAAPDEYLWVAATVQFFQHDYRTALATALKMENPEPFGRFIAVCATLTGDQKLARRYRDRMLQRQPDFRIADWRNLVPLKSEHDKQFFEDGMRKAGFH